MEVFLAASIGWAGRGQKYLGVAKGQLGRALVTGEATLSLSASKCSPMYFFSDYLLCGLPCIYSVLALALFVKPASGKLCTILEAS
jgi:hypothetical protein